jgi:hypothetical protein
MQIARNHGTLKINTKMTVNKLLVDFYPGEQQLNLFVAPGVSRISTV